MLEGFADLLRAFLGLLDARSVFAVGAVGLLGLAIGSFLSVVVVRLPVMLDLRASDDRMAGPVEGTAHAAERLTLVSPGSRCVHCGHRLRWYENIPVVSYLFLRARCTACKGIISPLYPAVELLAGGAALVAALRFGADPRLLGALLLSFALVAVALIDARHFIVPDDIVLPMLWLGLLANAFELFGPLKAAVFGTVAAYAVLWTVYWVHRTATGKEGMGRGDFKLAAMFGAWLGVGSVPVVLFLAFAAGAVFGIGLMIAGRAKLASAIPFGPFLAFAGWVALYWGDSLVSVFWRFVLP